MTTSKRFPRQEDCDMTDPEEHFFWALTQIPMGPHNNQPIQPSIARTISKHLHECGFRHFPKLQTKKQQMPHRGQQHYLNGSAVWVDINAEDPEPVHLPDVRSMTTHEKQLMVEELENIGFIKEPQKDLGKTAEIVKFSDIVPTKIKKASDFRGER